MNLGRTWSVWPMYPKYFCTDCHDTRQHEYSSQAAATAAYRQPMAPGA